MSKKILQLLSLLCVVLGSLFLITRWLWGPTVPFTHDGENHLARFANYRAAIREGQYPPRWAPYLVHGYGYPVFNYNYPLPSIVSVPISLVSNYQRAFTLQLIFAVLLAIVGTGLLGFHFKKSPEIVTLAVLGYVLQPYIWNALYYRGSIGEIWIWSLLPWLVLDICRKNVVTQSKVEAVFFIAIWTAWWLGHNVGVLVTLPLLLTIPGILQNQVPMSFRGWLKGYSSMIWSAGLGLWFWIPALWEKSLVVLDTATISNSLASHSPTVLELMFAPIRFGFSYLGPIDTLSFQVGWVFWGLVLASVVTVETIIWQEKSIGKLKQWRLFFLLGLITLYLAGQISVFAYALQQIPLFKFIQFPWRLSLGLPLITITWIFVLFSRSYSGKRYVIVAATVLLQGYIFLRLPEPAKINKPDAAYDSFSESSTTGNENLPKTFTLSLAEAGGTSPFFLKGSGEVRNLLWRGSFRSYEIQSNDQVVVVEPTMVFPGWKTQVTNGQTNVTEKVSYVDSDEIKGRIAYSLEPGVYQVKTSFTQQTPARVLGNGMSVATVVVMLFKFLIPLPRKSKNQVIV